MEDFPYWKYFSNMDFQVSQILFATSSQLLCVILRFFHLCRLKRPANIF